MPKWDSRATWGIVAYSPEADFRAEDDPDRVIEEMNARLPCGCGDPYCVAGLPEPLAAMADERDERHGVLDSTERVRLFASAHAEMMAWRDATKPQEVPGASDFVGEHGMGAKRALAAMALLSVLRPVLAPRSPLRRRIRGSDPAASPTHGR